MSTIEFTCSNCAKTFRVRSEFAGKSTHCPACSQRVQIAGTAPPVDIWKVEPRPRRELVSTQAIEGMNPRDRDTMLKSVRREITSMKVLGITAPVTILILLLINWMTPQQFFIHATPFLLFLVLFSLFLVCLLRARLTALQIVANHHLKPVARASLFCLIPGLIAFLVVDLSIVYEWLCIHIDDLNFARTYWAMDYYWFWDFFTWFSTSAALFSFWMWIVQANTVLQSEAISRRNANMMRGLGFYFLASILLLVGGRYTYQVETSRLAGERLVTFTFLWISLLMVVFLPFYWLLLKEVRRVLQAPEVN